MFLALLLALSGAAQAQAAHLQGTWATDCTPLKKRHAVTSEVAFNGPELKALHRLYADKECRTLNLEILYAGTHEVAGRAFRWTPSSITLKILHPDVVTHYNAKALCGYTDWKFGEARPIAGLYCKPNHVPNAGVTYSDHHSLRGRTLTLGAFPEMPPKPGRKSQMLAAPLLYKKRP